MEALQKGQKAKTEGQKILTQWNQTESEFDNCSLPALFTMQVARTPDAIAVQFGTQTLTYVELNERANQMAHWLQSHKVIPDSHVAVSLDRSLDLVIAILGILKAGCAYVPLDPAYPTERLNFILNDSNSVALVTTTVYRKKFSQYAGHLINMDMDRPEIQKQVIVNPAISISPHSLVYIIYTSGSTGQPKGVMVEHYGWANYVKSSHETYQLQAGEHVLQFSSISWDTSVEEIFPCLTSGATLVLRPDDMIDSIPHFIETCVSMKVSVLLLPTAFWHELVGQCYSQHLTLPSSLRVVAIGGERAQWEVLSKWWDCRPAQTHLFNTYGQTECTAVTTCVEITPEITSTAIPIGKPVHNVRTYVLDEALIPVPVGQPGELFVGGTGVARGYLNQPELTAQKFIPDPFGKPGQRLYRTGDLVRYWQDGNLEFVGRVDQQVKIRGIRIEPGEIEAVLLQHPEVIGAVVVGHPTGPNPEYLAGYVVLRTGSYTGPADLRAWLKERIPNHLVPTVVLQLDVIPLTPNGKLDRSVLPVPDFSNQTTEEDDESLTEMQDVVASFFICYYSRSTAQQ